MYRNQQKKIKINFLFNQGGIGDLVGSIPALDYVHKFHPHVYQTIWVGDFGVEFVKRSLPKDDRIQVRPFKDIKNFDATSYTRSVGYGSTFTNFATHLTKHAFSMLVNIEPENKHLNYIPMRQDNLDINRFNLNKRQYIVLNVGHTAAVREWKPEYINQVAKYIKDKGYTPVFMGKAETENGTGYIIKGHTSEGIDYSLGLDLRDKTTLCEAQVVISKSAGIVGLDNGLLHIAGTTEVPIVGAFTSVKPMHRMPYRHDELGWNYFSIFLDKKQLSCSGCQSNMAFTPGHKFDTCYYIDKKCLDLITPEMYMAELEKIL